MSDGQAQSRIVLSVFVGGQHGLQLAQGAFQNADGSTGQFLLVGSFRHTRREQRQQAVGQEQRAQDDARREEHDKIALGKGRRAVGHRERQGEDDGKGDGALRTAHGKHQRVLQQAADALAPMGRRWRRCGVGEGWFVSTVSTFDAFFRSVRRRLRRRPTR